MKRRPPLITGVFYFMEVWKKIPNYEGLYEVSNLGNVKSLGNDKTRKEKILKAGINSQGYCHVGLVKDKQRNFFKVHQLVAMAFLNHIPCGYKLVVDHINDTPLDNRVENLQIVTQRFNANKTQVKYTSKYKGVSWHKNNFKWISNILINKKRIHLGYFNTELEASVAYQNKLKEILC